MAEESDNEKTESPSQKRIDQARAEGQVPQSRELSTFLVMIAGVGCLWMFGAWFTQHVQGIVRQGLVFDRKAAYDTQAMFSALYGAASEGLLACSPLLLLTIVAAVGAPIMIGGWNVTSKPLTPDLTKLNPLSGLSRMFSKNSLVELAKAVAKSLVVAAVAFWVVRAEQDQIFALASTPLDVGMHGIGRLLMLSTLLLVGGIGLVAAVDVPWQLWHYHSQLKMSREELKQEAKEAEGDPQIKARIRSAQREMARKRMMAEVPKADVVVTNPTHYAVALKYDADKMGAPRVVAKGMNLIAANIRELAKTNDVPLLEAPPLARALYKHSEIGDEVPAQLYTAVAEVMAYVYQLNHFMSQGGLPPQAPSDLPVPKDMDPGPGEA